MSPWFIDASPFLVRSALETKRSVGLTEQVALDGGWFTFGSLDVDEDGFQEYFSLPLRLSHYVIVLHLK